MSILLYTTGTVLSNTRTGGMKRFVELSKYINANNKDVCFCSMDASSVIKNVGFENSVTLTPPSSNYIYRMLLPELSILLMNYKKIRTLRRQRFSVVVVFDVPTAIGLCLMGFENVNLLLRKDMIGYEKVNARNKGLKFWSKLFVQWICESICFFCSKVIITQCRYDLNRICGRHPFLRRLLLRKTKIQINNVNPSWIVSKTSVEKSNDTDNECFKICFIGDFNSDRKGHNLLLPVACKLLDKYRNLEFKIIGDGVQLAQCKKKYEQYENIKFMGRLANPIKVLKSCNLLVVPSYADSCPNTVMEALYNNIPVIGSKAGGIPEILNIDAALFDLTQESLLLKLDNLISNPQGLEEIKALEGKRKLELEFNWSERIVNLLAE